MTTNATEPDPEQQFQLRLLKAIHEVGQHTRLGVASIWKDVVSIGLLQTAKRRLAVRSRIFNLTVSPSDYFFTTRRIGRIDLSIEAIALEPNWSGLFTREELDQAMATLAEYGYDPALESMVLPIECTDVMIEHEPSLASIRLHEPTHRFYGDQRAVVMGASECEVTAALATALRTRANPPAQPLVRRHLSECLTCRDLYPDLIAALYRFDEAAISQWRVLLTNLQAAMELGDERLERFMLPGPGDYEDREAYETDLDMQVQCSIRPLCAWRATRVGCQVGRFMSAFEATFEEGEDLWLRWRKGEVKGPVADAVRTVGREHFLLALLSRNLLRVRSWPIEDEGVLWLPADEDLCSVPGVMQIDSSDDLDEWVELLGEPPQDLHLDGILYLAYSAALTELRILEPESRVVVPAAEPREQLNRVDDRTERMEAMLEALLISQTEAQDRQAEDRQWQVAVIAQMERIVLNMESTDRYACEEELKAQIPETYAKLTQKSRNCLLASEQSCRIPDFAAPGTIVHELALAFEIELQHQVMAGLFDHLDFKKVGTLTIPEEWIAKRLAEKRGTPLWSKKAKADKCTLGDMRLILRHPNPAVGDFFAQFGLSLADIQGAAELVYEHRNAATHGTYFDIGTARTIRSQWFHWNERPGGIFSVFFRNE